MSNYSYYQQRSLYSQQPGGTLVRDESPILLGDSCMEYTGKKIANLEMIIEQLESRKQANNVYIKSLKNTIKQLEEEIKNYKEKPLTIELLDKLAIKLKFADSDEMLTENDLLCPICMEPTINKLSPCDHPTCLSCLEKINKCPLCRATL